MKIFSNHHHFRNPTISLGQLHLQFVTRFPYLGDIITNNLKDGADSLLNTDAENYVPLAT